MLTQKYVKHSVLPICNFTFGMKRNFMPEQVVETPVQETIIKPEAQAAPVVAAAEEKPAFDVSTLDDSTRLKILNEAMGTSYKTLEEAKPKKEFTPQEKEAHAQQKKTKALEWAFGTGKVTKEQYDLAVAEKSKNPREIALALFAKDLREDNPKISNDDINSQFSDFYREEDEDTSPQRQRSLKLMDKIVREHLNEVSKPIDSIEADYDTNQATEQRYSGYTAQVKAVAQTLPTKLTFSIPYKSVDGSETTAEYEFPVEESVIAAVRKEFQHANTFYYTGADSKDLKDADIAKEMTEAIESRLMRKAIPFVLEKHQERVEQDMEAKLKAIPATGANPLAGKTITTGAGKTPPTYPALKQHQK